ncbi:MAG: winged helix-turn-helix transcriptional regulator [bacterium]|nr:winged helix-turn-helix transcriptional regulator [bacterium]
MEPPAKLFGSATRTDILVAVALLEETYARELARALELAPLTVQRILNDLEREGALVSRLVGRSRVFAINPRMYGGIELREFLMKYARKTTVQERLARLRRRPRRAGKDV